MRHVDRIALELKIRTLLQQAYTNGWEDALDLADEQGNLVDSVGGAQEYVASEAGVREILREIARALPEEIRL